MFCGQLMATGTGKVQNMENKNNNTIGSRIKECRKAKHLTQEQLAEILLTSKMTISHYENDKYDLSSSTLQLVAEALDTSVSYLVDGIVPPNEREQEFLKLLRSLKTEQMMNIAFSQLQVMVDMQN